MPFHSRRGPRASVQAIGAAAVLAMFGCSSADETVRIDTDGAQVSLVAAGSAEGSEAACRAVSESRDLPSDVRETSGLAQSRSAPHRFWTHNDAGNEPVLFAIDTAGKLAGRVRVPGATLVDWEDIEAGPCEAGSCLYVADIGDNDGKRDSVTVYVVPEPAADGATASRATAIHAKYPDGSRDAEALFVLPSGDVYIVTKGRETDIALYRLPKGGQRAGKATTLERVRDLWPEPKNQDDRVTAATASPDGKWVAIRTLSALHLYPAAALTGKGKVSPVTTDLGSVGGKQGEAVVLQNDGTVWLTSEAAKKKERAQLTRLQCTLGGA